MIMANFTEKQKDFVWEKAKKVKNFDPDKYRKDSADAWMQRDKYGKEENYGWEVDHMFPESLGGDKNEVNIQAFQWENNRIKSNDFPNYGTSVTSDGNSYLKKEQSWEFNDIFIKRLKQIYPNNKHL